MPYIDHKHRSALVKRAMTPGTPGELNFVISDLVNDYIGERGTGYAVLNEVIGVLECAKLEVYRRLSPYEDIKLERNGEVFTAAEHFIRAAGLL